MYAFTIAVNVIVTMLVFLRLIGYISLYSGIGFALYHAITENTGDATYLWIGIGLIALGGIILLLTPKAVSNRRDALDWLDILDWLELPFELLIWVFKGIFKIFD